ncbi:hypothetical protein [Undibacterium sp. YM2]|uniref:hypothetical protein n=1 Tax=Undibacterium sp. YM2 TaxID=2058625 RepID=UPI001E64AC0D|nr:hypothetical protein [Undibacterium sp. YM2]
MSLFKFSGIFLLMLTSLTACDRLGLPDPRKKQRPANQMPVPPAAPAAMLAAP